MKPVPISPIGLTSLRQCDIILIDKLQYHSRLSLIIIEKEMKKSFIDCLKNNDYRMAVRMLYHKILKELNLAKIITWKLDKTNDDYINEIKNDSIKKSFKELTHFFNFVWYGMFNINNDEFNEINNKFDQFILEIKKDAS